MNDFIPSSDAEFNQFQLSLVGKIVLNVVVWGITPEDVNTLLQKQTSWNTIYAKASNKFDRTLGDVQSKKDIRVDYVSYIRHFTKKWLAFNDLITDGDRESMGLHVRTNSHTPVSTPTSVPIGKIDFSFRLRHDIHFTDENSVRSKAKPHGVLGCEIKIKIDGTPPINESELTHLTIASRTPFVNNFTGADASKPVYYWLRWVTATGKKGPWSGTISAIVQG